MSPPPKLGDKSAVRLYDAAAYELAQSVRGVARQLNLMEQKTEVSYYGGIFHCGAWILDSFSEHLNQMGFVLKAPSLSPLGGGILLAAERCERQINEIVDNLNQYENRLQMRIP